MHRSGTSTSIVSRMGRALWAAKWVMFTALVATTVPAVVLTLIYDRPYRAEAAMLIERVPADVAGQAAADPSGRLLHEIAVLESADIQQRVRDDLRVSGDLPEVRGRLDIAADTIVARVEGPDPLSTATLANGYVDAYIAMQRDRLADVTNTAIARIETDVAALSEQIDSMDIDDPQRSSLVDQRDVLRGSLQSLHIELAAAREPAQVVRRATEPDEPIEAPIKRVLLLSLGVGTVLGAIGVMVLHRGDQKVRTAHDLRSLRTTEPVLAVVPADHSGESAPIVIRQPVGRIPEAYAHVCAAVRRAVTDRGLQVIQCCSPSDGDGASVTAVNVAVLLSRSGANVVLVDLDLRNADVHTMLSLARAPGFTDALDEERDDTDGIPALSRLDLLDRDPSGGFLRPAMSTFDGADSAVAIDPAAVELAPAPLFLPIAYYRDLSVITAGTPPRSALEVLSRSRLRELIDDLRVLYDIVILTSPPLSMGGDATAIARHADGAVMVVKAGTTTLPALRQSLGAVERAGARIMGVVLTM